MRKKITAMSIFLPHGCRVGKISVHPANWESPEADPSATWYIFYRFHDPRYRQKYPKGYPVQLRGMNDIKTLSTKRRVTRGLIENELRKLAAGLNPILGHIIPASEREISPDCPFEAALKKAFEMLPPSKTKKEVGKALVHIGQAIKRLQYSALEIGEVRRRHAFAILQEISSCREAATGKPWGAASYNHYRSYLIMLFRQLDIAEACEVNLQKIPVRKGVKKRRIMPTDEELVLIDQQLQERFYSFWRFKEIFFRSGARMAELMKVRAQDVEMGRFGFWVTIYKRGGDAEQVFKTITPAVEDLWRELLTEAGPGDYLFSRDLRPGASPISEHQVTKRWRVHVKEKLGIQADFYSLKKKNTTDVVSAALEKIRAAQQVAADINSHTSTGMVQKHYDDLASERLHHQLRAI